MKKIALIAFLLAVCVQRAALRRAGRISASAGQPLLSPLLLHPPDVQVHSNTAYGALLSYRFMLTPNSALEANYGITYQNSMRFISGNTNTVKVLVADAGNFGRIRAQLHIPEVQPFCGGWAGRV